MSLELNHTHDAKARSWVESANRSGSDFPIQNLPYAAFRRQSAEAWRGGIAIGDEVVDLATLSQKGLLEGLAATAAAACSQSNLNAFFEMGPSAWQALRHGMFRLISLDANPEQQRAFAECLVPQAGPPWTRYPGDGFYALVLWPRIQRTFQIDDDQKAANRPTS